MLDSRIESLQLTLKLPDLFDIRDRLGSGNESEFLLRVEGSDLELQARIYQDH